MTDVERTLVVLQPAGGDLFALAVDRIHDHEELVVKPAAPAVMATGLYAGTTLADDGSPILLFDPAGLAEVGGIRLEAQERASRVAEDRAAAAVAPTIPVLLFRGLDGARRAIRLGVVDRIEEVAARRDPPRRRPAARPARRGDPAAGRRADRHRASTARSACSASTTARTRSAMPSREVIDLMTIDHDVIPADVPGEVSAASP